MDNDTEELRDKEGDEGSSKIKGQRVLEEKKFGDNEKEKIWCRREYRQQRMKINQNTQFLRINYVESESDNEEGEETISLAAIKAKYKPLIGGKLPKNADKGQAQRPRKIRRVISDDEEEEEPASLKRKAESEEMPVKLQCIIEEEVDDYAEYACEA